MYGRHGFGHGMSSSFGGAAAAYAGGKIAKKILGAYVKIKIAKYALKFGAEAAKIYFRYKLGYDLREEAINKFVRRYQMKANRRQKLLRERLNLDNDTALNITMGG